MLYVMVFILGGIFGVVLTAVVSVARVRKIKLNGKSEISS